MTLLELVQEFCLRRGLPKPLILMSSQDDQLLQIAALGNEIIDDLSTRRVWTKFRKEATWTSTAAEDQGDLETLAPGCQWINNSTIWDRTQNLPCPGPVNPAAWAEIKGTNSTGVSYAYRIMGGRLLFSPALPAGHTMAFEYTSRYLVKSASGAYKQYFTADDDQFLLPDAIMLAGLNWKWREEKGFKYGEPFRAYESIIADTAGHDGTKPVLRMDGGCEMPRPGILVPNGNWSL